MSKEEKEKIGASFWKLVSRGRRNAKAYCEMILRFGDIFAKEKLGKGKTIIRKIATGIHISDVITENMEAFMQTAQELSLIHI